MCKKGPDVGVHYATDMIDVMGFGMYVIGVSQVPLIPSLRLV